MRMSRSARRAFGTVVAFIVLAGCGGAPTQLDPAGPALPAGSSSGMGPAVKQFGVGLGDSAGAEGDVSSYRYGWCNGAPANPSGCYSEVPGKRKFTNGSSGSINLVNDSNKSDGYADAKINASSKLGSGSYTLLGEVDEDVKLLKNVSAAAQIEASDWDDTFTIASQTLKQGTPVTIDVKLTLKESTNVACDSAQNSFGELDLYSPSVTPPSGSQFAIGGYCENGSFEYYLYGNSKQPGTTAVGTINTAVGDSFTFYFVASGQAMACQPTNYCTGDIVASLHGTYKFTITSITSGATYTTASGNTYQ
jgi:hypothetical protein